MKTAMEQVMDIYQQNENELVPKEDLLNLLRSMRMIEKRQIMQAYNFGYSDRSIGRDNQYSDYFKTTYNEKD